MISLNLGLLVVSVFLYGFVYNFKNYVKLFFLLSVLCRVIQGIAVATIGVIGNSIIMSIFPKDVF